MPSLPSSNTWQSIPSNLPPFQHPTALRLAPSHMKPTTARSSRAASWKTAFSGSWHDISVYFCWFIGEIWGIYALWMQQMSIEIWGKYLLAYPIAQSGLGRNNWTNRIPRGYPGYQWWMALFHMKSMGNLWEIYGNQRYQPSKMEHAQRSAFGRPEPGLLWNFTKTNDVAVYRALMDEWHGEFKPCPEWIIWPMCRKKKRGMAQTLVLYGLRHRHMIWYLEKKHMKWIWNGASKHHSGTEDTNTKKRRQEVWETANEHRYRCYFLNVQNMEPL